MSLAKLAVLAAGCAAIVACTPASEELPPAGATGFTTKPSAAAQGQPIVSADGWTLRFTTFAVSASVYATTRLSTGCCGGQSRSANWAWDASQVVSVFAPGLDVGKARVQLELRGNFVPRERYDDRRKRIGITPEVQARFEGLPDDGLSNPLDGYGYGPSVVFAMTAEQGGRKLTIDLALSTSYYVYLGNDDGPEVEIREDTFSPVPLTLEPKNLFVREGVVRFSDYADVDLDGDGKLSAAELRSKAIEVKAITSAGSGTGGSSSTPTKRKTDLLDLLVERIPTIIAYH